MRYKTIVRFGATTTIAEFHAKFSGLRRSDKCIIRTARGVETGEIISPVEPVENPEEANTPAGEILRKMAPEDHQKVRHIHEELEPAAVKFCQRRIRERGLSMKLASVEHLFGGNKIIFYFLADGRIDFRALVRDLAQEYRTRIEMRQIGVRDEARLLADFEHCGRELCCRTFLRHLQPVTMKMAKNQKATLDPAKISGRCGRLMCCLRFEDQMYEELRRELPRRGGRVSTEFGVCQVLDQDILAQTVTVVTQDNREMVIPADKVSRVGGKRPRADDRSGSPGRRADKASSGDAS